MPPELSLTLAVALLLVGLRLLYPPVRAQRSTDPRPTCLYRFYDDRGRLVYVGITNHLGRRLGQHNKAKPWWRDVARVSVEHFTDRQQALDAELAAIRRERPRHNVQHARRRHR